MMEILSELQIVERLENRQPFTARAENGSFEICVTRYLPMVVTAIHDGHEVTAGLAAQMKVTDEQRRFEEDPYTGAVAEAFDISIRGLDSRYCCDLNRSPERCIYEEAWGRLQGCRRVAGVRRRPHRIGRGGGSTDHRRDDGAATDEDTVRSVAAGGVLANQAMNYLMSPRAWPS